LGKLAELRTGFSGAEIEQVIAAGLIRRSARSSSFIPEILLAEFRASRPVSAVTRAEEITFESQLGEKQGCAGRNEGRSRT